MVMGLTVALIVAVTAAAAVPAEAGRAAADAPASTDWSPTALAYSPDGKTLTVGSRAGLTVYPTGGTSSYGTVKFGDGSPLRSLAYTKSGRIYAASCSGHVFVVDPPYREVGGTLDATLDADQCVRTLQVNADSSRLYVASADGFVRSFDVASNKLLLSTKLTNGLRDMALSPDGKRLYLAIEGVKGVTVLDTATLAPVGLWSTKNALWNVAVDPTGKWVYAYGVYDDLLRLSSATGVGTVISDIFVQGGMVLNPSGTRMYTSDGSDVVEMDATTGAEIHRQFWAEYVDSIAITPAGDQVSTIAHSSVWYGAAPFDRNSSSVGVVPGPVTAARASVSGGKVIVTWKKPSGVPATKFSVYDNAFDGDTCTTTGYTCIMTGLKKGKKYTFSVYGSNTRGYGKSVDTNSVINPAHTGGSKTSPGTSRPSEPPQRQAKPPQVVS